ncbi:MAG TPA: UPF0175 family protein [Candidatus Angelobacter sp.]|jgi:hypothetical protein|nr:UPF0175 family protein [Candidatus Angelobacter sp.]
MQVTINLPEELVRYLGKNATELSHAAVEGLVLEGVRSGKLSVAQGRRVLGFLSRHQMETFLKFHGVDLPLTIEQVRSDSDNALAFSQ